jgi:hypothetical protein
VKGRLLASKSYTWQLYYEFKVISITKAIFTLNDDDNNNNNNKIYKIAELSSFEASNQGRLLVNGPIEA